MRTFKKHLNEKFKDLEFKELYEEEKRLLSLSLKLLERRTRLGLSQKQLASKANITQQQLSKIEKGINCNILTYLKVLRVLGLELDVRTKSRKTVTAPTL